MDRRDLLKSIAGIAAIRQIPPVAKDVEQNPNAVAYELNDGKPYYLFVLDVAMCDVDDFVNAFHQAKIRGGVVPVNSHGDLDNFLRIYKLEE